MAALRRILAVMAALTVAGAGLVGTSVASASACTCAQMALGSLAKNADAVFVGTVDDERTEGGDHVYTLRVSDVYSGSPGSTTTVRTSADEGACGVTMQPGEQYMVVGDQPKLHGDVTTTECSGTRPISDRTIAMVERALGPATPYRGAVGENGGQDNDKQNDKGGKGPNTQNDGQQNGGSDGSAQSDGGGALTDPASESSDEDTTSKIMVGAILAAVIGVAFTVPWLRRRRR